jgi:hypothetical protein
MDSALDNESAPVILDSRKARKSGSKVKNIKKEVEPVVNLDDEGFNISIASEGPLEHQVGKNASPKTSPKKQDNAESGDDSSEEEKEAETEQGDQANKLEVDKLNIELKKRLSKGSNISFEPAELPADLKNFGEPVELSRSDQSVVTDESSSLSDGTTEESDVEISEKEAKIHAEIKKIEGNNFYYKKFVPILLTIVGSLTMILLRGGKGFPSIIGAEKCTGKDWVLFATYLIFICAIAYTTGKVVYNE